MEKNLLLIGGAGYVGSHVNKELNRLGYQTLTIDNLSRGHREAVRWGKFYEGDYGDRAFLEQVFSAHRIDAVMHFGSFAYVGESVTEPRLYYRNNVANTLTLLDAMLDHGVKKFIFSSTCATFGVMKNATDVIVETDPQVPINPYGRTKLIIEQVLKDYQDAYGLDSCVFRYFNAAGCDPDGEIGENHVPETHVIPLVLRSTMSDQPEFRIMGTDHDTPDGTCIRDYVHVCDIARAHALGFEYLEQNSGFHDFNLANGQGFSVKEVIASVEKVTERQVRKANAPKRPGDPARLVGGAEKARKILGWEPRYRTLEAILETAWLWETRR